MPTHEYRAIYHDREGKPRVIRPANAADDTPDQIGRVLEQYIETGLATGGHVETFVPGIGWVVFD
jgi:hypothetical protein